MLQQCSRHGWVRTGLVAYAHGRETSRSKFTAGPTRPIIHVRAASTHPGGANFLFSDGSVKFISQNVDRTLYNALGSKAGKETIGNVDAFRKARTFMSNHNLRGTWSWITTTVLLATGCGQKPTPSVGNTSPPLLAPAEEKKYKESYQDYMQMVAPSGTQIPRPPQQGGEEKQGDQP